MRIHRSLQLQILRRDHWTCVYCGSGDRLEIDHVIPEARGGSTVPANLATACRKCNEGRGAKALDSVTLGRVLKKIQANTAFLGWRERIAAGLLRVWKIQAGRSAPKHFEYRLQYLLCSYRYSDLLDAVMIAGGKSFAKEEARARYFHGVVRKFEKEERLP